MRRVESAALAGVVLLLVGCAHGPPQTTVPSGHLHLAGGTFERWVGNAPAGWISYPIAIARGDVRRARHGKGGAVSIIASKPRFGDGWHLAQIVQKLPSSLGRLVVFVRPHSDYVGSAYADSVSGVQLIDAHDHTRYYAINSRLREPRTFRRPGVSVYTLPGKIGSWNRLVIDVVPRDGDAFVASEHEPMEMRLVAAYRDAAFVTARAGAEFGPIETP